MFVYTFIYFFYYHFLVWVGVFFFASFSFLFFVFLLLLVFFFRFSYFNYDSFVIGTTATNDTGNDCPRPMIVTATIEDSAPTSSSATLDDVLNSLLGLAPVSPYQTMRRPISQPVMNRNQQQHERLKQTNSERTHQPSNSELERRSFNDIRSASNFCSGSGSR